MANVEALSTSKYIIIVVNAFTAFTAIVFNSLTIQAIRKTPSLPKPLKTLLLSLELEYFLQNFSQVVVGNPIGTRERFVPRYRRSKFGQIPSRSSSS